MNRLIALLPLLLLMCACGDPPAAQSVPDGWVYWKQTEQGTFYTKLRQNEYQVRVAPTDAAVLDAALAELDLPITDPRTSTVAGQTVLHGNTTYRGKPRELAAIFRESAGERTVVALLGPVGQLATVGGADLLTSVHFPVTPTPEDEAYEEEDPAAAATPPAAPTPTNAFTYRQPRSLPDYPAPTSQADLRQWPKGPGEPLWRVQRRGDPYSPRAVLAQTGPEFNVYDFDGAVEDVLQDAPVDLRAPLRFTRLAAWTRFDGRDARIALAPTTYGGTDGVLFVYGSRQVDSDQYGILMVETTEATFRQWGGIARILMIRDVIDGLDVFPPERLAQLRRAPLREQIPVYEASLDALYQFLAIQFMQTQAQTITAMRELNYDLLFGDDISSPIPD